MLFQYQAFAEPVTVPAATPAPELSWQPSYPDRVPVRTTPQAWPEYPLQQPVAPLHSWDPEYPDTVPIVRPAWAQPFTTRIDRIDPFAPLGWIFTPDFPSRVPRSARRSPIAPDQPFLAPVLFVPTQWPPSYPDRVPVRRLPPPLDVALTRLPDVVIVPDFWAPSYPDRAPAPYRIVPPDFFPGLVPIAPSLPGRWAPRGPTYALEEQGSARYHAQLVQADGVTPLPGSVLTSLRLTLYLIDAADLDVIVNGRNRQDVLNVNNVTVSASGLVTWIIQPGDTTLSSAAPFERHIALFEWGWAGGQGKREIILVVHNRRQVP